MILGRRYTTNAKCQAFNSKDKTVIEFPIVLEGKCSEQKISRAARAYCKVNSIKGKDGVKFTFLQVLEKSYVYERFGMPEEKFFAEAEKLDETI